MVWDLKQGDFKENSLEYPIKGYNLLRKKESVVASVGGLCFDQAPEEKNTFIVGSEAGSVVRANVFNNQMDKKNKIIMDQ